MPIRTRSPVRPTTRLSGMRAATWFYFAAVAAIGVGAACLWKSGEWLVHPDPEPAHVHWAAVLAGEGRDMERTEAAWSLFQDGRFDSLILSGPRIFKTHYESEFSSELLRAKGLPRDRLFTLPSEATSTVEEAEVLIKQARLLGIDTLLLITSDYHTARARRIYRRLAGGSPFILVYGAETPDFDPKAWWSSRASKETWTIEWIKTLNSDWELFRKKPLRGAADYVLIEPNPAGDIRMDHPITMGVDTSLVSPASIDSLRSDSSRGPLSHVQDSVAPISAADSGRDSLKIKAPALQNSAVPTNAAKAGESSRKTTSKSNGKNGKENSAKAKAKTKKN